MENMPITPSLPMPASGTGKSTPASAEAAASDAGGSDGFDAVLQRQLSGEPDAAPAQASSDNATDSATARDHATSEAPAYPTASDSLVATLLAAPAMKALAPVDDRASSALASEIETLTKAVVRAADQAEYLAASEAASRPAATGIAALAHGADVPLPLHAHALASVASRQAQAAGPASAQESRLAPAVGASGWDSALAQKVIWQVGQQHQIKEGPLPEAKTHAAGQAEIFAASGKTMPKPAPLQTSSGLTAAVVRAADQAEYLAASEAASRPAATGIAALAHGADVPLPLHAHALASVASRQAQGAGPASAQESRLAPAVGASGWDSALAQKVIWQVGQQHQMAELHLNPPQLGPLQVQVSMTADQGGNIATVHFVSQHAAVREALEAAMPRMREMLAESGISLGNTTVGNGAFPQQHFAQAGSHPSLRRAGNEAGAEIIADGVMRAVRNGMVDTFA